MAGIVRGNRARLQVPSTKLASVRPRAARGYATTGPSSSSGTTSSRSTYALYGAMGLVLVGAAATRLVSDPTRLDATKESEMEDREREFEKFGSPVDFKKAIEQLRADLPPDAVSTDLDVLKDHGFSVNVSTKPPTSACGT